MRVIVFRTGTDSHDFTCMPTILDVLILLRKEFPLLYRANIFTSEECLQGTQVINLSKTIAWVKENQKERNRHLKQDLLFINTSYA